MTARTDVYRCWAADGRLLYIGMSMGVAHRLSEHRRTAAWFPEVAKVTTQTYQSRDEAMTAERIAIQHERPIHNKDRHVPAMLPPITSETAA